MKRLLALILAMAMTFSVVMPSVAAAAESSGVSSAVSEDGSLSVLEAQESSSAANKSSEKTEKEASEEEASVEKSSEKESSSETTEPSAKDEEHSSEKEETSPEKESSEREKQGKEKNTPVESVQSKLEESSVREEDFEQEASAQETLAEALESKPEEFKTVKGSLKGVDGTKYTVTLVYGKNAEIPDGAKLSLVELNTELTEEEKKLKENKDRPYDTEKFLSEKALEQDTFDLHQGLKVQEKDCVLFTKFLDISLEKNGKNIQPKAPVSMTVETDAVEEGASDALELAFYDAEATRNWKEKREKLVKEQEEKIKSGKLKKEDAKRFEEKVFTPLELANETEKKKGTRVTFMTEKIARLGISAVAKELKSWKVKDNTVSVYGPRSLKAKVNTESMKTPEAGVEKVRAFSVSTNEKKENSPDYDVTYWVSTQAQSAEPEGLAAQAEKSAVDAGVVVSELKNSKAKKELIGTEGTSAPVAIREGEKIGVSYDTGLREQSVEADNVKLEGMLPKNADVTASDMLWRYSRPEDVKEDVQKGEAKTLAAYDITIESNSREFQPEEGESVGVSISGVKVSDKEKVEIWHVRDDGSVEVIRDFKVKGDTVSFKAEGFSVYMVVQYTVDFHWGDYTYNLEGGSTIFLSELLETLINGASESGNKALEATEGADGTVEAGTSTEGTENRSLHSGSAGVYDTTTLKKVLDDFDQIESVTFTDPELLAIDKVQILEGEPELIEDDYSEELIENLRDDWRIVSLKSFTSNEMLTIKLKDGSSVQVPVTDEIWGDDAGETVTPAGGSNALPRVTADGVTYIIRTRDNYADVYAISANCTIHDYIYYNNKAYPTKDIDQGVGRLTRNKNSMDWELVSRAAEHEIELPEVLTQPANDPVNDGYVAGSGNTYVDTDGTRKPSINQFWKKATYDPSSNSIVYSLKYFQAMKKKVPLDFIFIYDDSASMYSGTRTTGGVRMSEAQVTRVLLLDAAKALLEGNAVNGGADYDFRIFLGGTSTGDKRNSLASNPNGFENYEDVVTYLSTYNTGVTDYTVGLENARDMARASVKNGRTPVVVWLSDFHQALEGSRLLRTRDFAIADQLHDLARVYGLSSDYGWASLTVKAVCTAADTVFTLRSGSLRPGVQELENLIKHAIGYYMEDKVTVTDTLSNALSGITPVNGTATGTQTAAKGKETWELGGTKDSSGNYPSAATLYEETFTVKLDDNQVYAGAMPTNGSATVYVDGEKVNEIGGDALNLGQGITFWMGKLNELDNTDNQMDGNGAPLSMHKVSGIQFTLTKQGETTPIDTYETVNGSFQIPFKKNGNVVLELGATYILHEVESSVTTYNANNGENDKDLVLPDKDWLIKVGTNGIVTTEISGEANQTPEITHAKPSQFVIWNQIVVPATLIPITVQKIWDSSETGHRDSVPFTIYGVDRSGNNEPVKLNAYNGSNMNNAQQVKYITADDNSVDNNANKWTQTVYVPDKTVTSEGEVKYYTYEGALDINNIDSNAYYKLGDTKMTGDEWTNSGLADSEGKVYYGQKYSYNISEGDILYPEGWYTAEYTNNASDKTGNTNDSVSSTLAYWNAGDPSGWRTYGTKNGETVSTETTSTKYQVHYNNGGLDDKGGYTGDNNFYRGIDYVEMEIHNSTSNAKVKDYHVEFKPGTWASNPGPGVIFTGIALPSEWDTYFPTSVSSNAGNDYSTIKVLSITKFVFHMKNGRTVNIYKDGIFDGTSSRSPNSGNYLYGLYIERYIPGSSIIANSGSHTVNRDVTTTAGKVPDTDSADTSQNKTFNAKPVLTIENTWHPNTLIPVQVVKNWKDGDNNPATDYGNDKYNVKQDVTFSIKGTTTKGGTVDVPIFESANSVWNTGQPEGKIELIKSGADANVNKAQWTKTVYVPTYDVLNTYDRATGTCEKYTYTIDKDELSDDAKAKIISNFTENVLVAEKDADGHPQGNWTQLVDYSTQEHQVTTEGTDDKWHTLTDLDGSTNFYFNPSSDLSSIKKIVIDFNYNAPSSDQYDRNYVMTLVLSSAKNFNKTSGNPHLVSFPGLSQLYNASVSMNSVKFINSSGNEQTITLNKFTGSGTSNIPAGYFKMSRSTSEPTSGYEDKTWVNNPEIKWCEVGVPDTTETISAPIFTLTNTYTPNMKVDLTSVFSDASADKESTKKIGKVVYTITGAGADNADYSRTVITNYTDTEKPVATDEGGVSKLTASKTVYIPKGEYKIEQTAYTIEAEKKQYKTVAYSTNAEIQVGTAEKQTKENSIVLNGASDGASITADTAVTFNNTRRVLPIIVQTLFDPEVTDEDAANTETRPLADRELKYTLRYQKEGESDPTVLPSADETYQLKDSEFITDSSDDAYKNYCKSHTTENVPAYSVRTEMTECHITNENAVAALPDYNVSTYGEIKKVNGVDTLILTVAADINRAQIIVSKSWDEETTAAEKDSVDLTFQIRRVDKDGNTQSIYGENGVEPIGLNITTDSEGEAYGTFILRGTAETGEVYLPTLRQHEIEAGVRYVLTETAASQGGTENTYYVNYADLTGKDNKLIQTKPGGKSGAAGGETTNEAKFVLTKDGITIDVNNANSPYICKIVETFGSEGTTRVEVPFRRLNYALKYARENGNGQAMGADNPVKIEMLVDYVIPGNSSTPTAPYVDNDRIILDQPTDNIIITTAATSGGVYNFTPTFAEGTAAGNRLSTDSKETAILKRGSDVGNNSLFTVSGTNASLRTENIILDGAGISVATNGTIIKASNGSLTIAGDTTVRNSKTNVTSSYHGGAIYAPVPVLFTTEQGETILFKNCETNKDGGVIETNGKKLTIKNKGTLKAEDCSANYGGFICTDTGGELEINNSGTIEVSGCTTSNNGGAIFTGVFKAENNSGRISFTDCTSKNNGGAIIANRSAASSDTFVLTNTSNGTASFKNCSTSSNGGAIYANGAVSISGDGASSFTGCTASSNGGAIYQAEGNALTLTNVTFGKKGKDDSGCMAAVEGGCIYSKGSVATLTDCNFYYGVAGDASKGNKARGGAIYYYGSTSLSVYGCVFDHCSAQTTSTNIGWGNGGAIFVDESNVALTIDKSDSGRRSSFTDCFAHRFGGAVMYEKNGGKSVSISSTDFTNCYTEIRGGGAFCTDSNQTTINDCTFKGCYDKSSSGGGAIQLHPDNSPGSNPSCSITNSTFEDCYTVSGNGGAIYNNSGSVPVTLTNVSIDGKKDRTTTNANAVLGSAIYCKGNLTIKQTGSGKSEIKNCLASDTNGGAVNVATGKTMTFEGNVVIYDNKDSGGKQKNVVLQYGVSNDYNKTINTSGSGLGADAHIGVYVIGTTGEPYLNHGKWSQPFGTAKSNTEANLEGFTNDRDESLFGMNAQDMGQTGSLIYWGRYVIKLTDATEAGNRLLYYKRTGDNKLLPAVFSSVKKGFEYAANELYYKDGTTAYANTQPIKAKMLADVTLSEGINYSTARDLTFTTAETTTEGNAYMDDNGDKYIFSTERTSDTDRAQLTKNHTSSMFTFGENAPLTVENLIFIGGGAATSASQGGAINQTANGMNASLTLTNVDFGALKADGTVDAAKQFNTSGEGGAVRTAVKTSAVITDCNFYGGQANWGAAVRFVGSDPANFEWSFTRCSFTDCYSTTIGAVASGATSNQFSNSKKNTFSECTFKNCYSGNYGGAMCIRTNDLEINDCTFENCYSNGSEGGAIYMDAHGDVDITRSNFKDCHGGSGRGGALYLKTQANSLTVSGSSFERCGVDSSGVAKNTEGGAIYASCKQITVQKSIAPSTAVTAGTAKGKEASAEIRSSFNICKANTNNGGGAIWTNANTGTASFTDTDFTDCDAHSGGGVYFSTGNKSSFDAEFKRCNFTNCDALNSSGYGGAICQVHGSSGPYFRNTTVEDCTFTNCSAMTFSGAVIIRSLEAEVSGSVFTDCYNTGGGHGGAAYFGKANAVAITRSTFSRCHTAGAGYGGAVATAESTPVLTIATSSFTDCQADGNGGAIYAAGNVILNNTNPSGTISFTNCSSYSQGGAVYFERNLSMDDNAGTISFTNCASALNKNNTAGVGDGGALCNWNTGYNLSAQRNKGTISFTNCTADNVRDQGGAIFLYRSGSITMSNSADAVGTISFKGCHDNAKNDEFGGGAISGWDNVTLTLTGTEAHPIEFEDCRTDNAGGGAIYINGTANLTHVNINGHTTGNTTSLAVGTVNATKGGAIYCNGNLTIVGGEIKNCSASDANGGAVQVAANKTMTFEGNVVIYGNPSTTTASGSQKNVVLDQNNNTTINTSGSGLGADAHIGVYVVGNNADPYNSHGKWSQPFGTAVTAYSEANLEKFTNDRDESLFGVNAQDMGKSDNTDKLIYWGRYICKIEDQNASGGKRESDSKPYEHAFVTLNRALTYARNSVNPTMSGSNAVSIQMLVDYEIPASDKVNLNANNDNITVTTAQTSGGVYNFKKTFGTNEGRKATDSAETAILSRKSGFNDDSLFTVNTSAKLTTTKIILDGNGINCTVNTDGGIVFVKNGGIMALTDGAVLRNSQLRAGKNGAGIYLEEGARLELSGNPSFGEDGNKVTDEDGKTKRQDIYIAGYLGTKDDEPIVATSLVVTGALTCGKGSIWVGAEQVENEENNHWDTLKQFAKFDSSLMTTDSNDNTIINSTKLNSTDVEKIYAAFRNATTTEEYHGAAGDNPQCIYWEGVQGSRKVILKKVGYNNISLKGAKFTITKGSTQIKGTDKNGNEVTEFESGDSGVFYIGVLDYGVYVLHETQNPEEYSGGPYFYLIVDEDGTEVSKPEKGYPTAADAKSAGDEEFKARKDARN